MIIMKNPQIKIHYSLIALLILACFIGKISTALAMLVILFIHELGHLIFLHLFKVKINKITFSMIGGMMDVNLEQLKGWQKLLIFRWRHRG